MPLQVYCHGKVVDVAVKDGRFFCSCCGRPLDWLVTYFHRRGADDPNLALLQGGLGNGNTERAAASGAGQ